MNFLVLPPRHPQMGQSREMLLGLDGWMSRNLVLGGGRLFEAGRLLTFSIFRVGA